MNKVVFIKFAIGIIIIMMSACSESVCTADSQDIVGTPVEFDFFIEDSTSTTRANVSLATDKTVYVTTDGSTYYQYLYDPTNSRWVAQGGSLTWSGKQMTVYAFVRNDGQQMSSGNLTTSISSEQSTNGYEDSDFLCCSGNYEYKTGFLKMTLKHKVAKLVVNVSNCMDASVTTLKTMTAFPTSANISLSNGNVTLTNSATTSVIKLYRSEYSVTSKTATFVAYLFPQESFNTQFTIGSGNLTFTSAALSSAIKLVGGQTSEINIDMPTVQTEYDYAYTGQVQTFTAPVTGNYLLEVWGAQGGSYDYALRGWSDYDNQMRGIGTCAGGLGAYVRGIVALTKNEKLYVYVGGQGIGDVSKGTIVSGDIYQLSGGWNGGGCIYIQEKVAVRTNTVQSGTAVEASRYQGGGGGGGATDIALNYNSENLKEWRNSNHLDNRIIVAGGGGGGCYVPNQQGWYTGGYGGGEFSWAGADGAGDAQSKGYGGTLTTFGEHGSGTAAGNIVVINNVESYDIVNINTNTAIPLDGGFGYGGSGRWGATSGESLGAGGGGWYGGGCANGTNSNGAGGGGSSYAYTKEVSYENKTLVDYWPSGKTKPDEKYLLKKVRNQINANEGNGRAKITLLLE